jgi:hypothetical protein
LLLVLPGHLKLPKKFITEKTPEKRIIEKWSLATSPAPSWTLNNTGA